MHINFDIENLRKKYNCANYFETRLCDPQTNVSSKQALLCGFDKVYCIETKRDWVELGKNIFNEDIEKNRYNLYLDDSTNIGKYLTGDEFNNRTMFFLSVNVNNMNIHDYKKRCPLFEELSAIANLERKDHIILIDDLRSIQSAFPWDETSYGNINFLKQIKIKILSINQNYKFSTLDGNIKNDVLIAYL